MPILRRRPLIVVSIAALLLGLAMLLPYPRQSLFGPTTRGKPWCVWEDAIWRHAHSQEYEKTLGARTWRWLGVEHQKMDFREFFDHAEMLPFILEMTNHSDPLIRQCALRQFDWCTKLREKSALPSLRARLADEDELCRINTACALHGIEPMELVFPVLVRILDDSSSRHRFEAMRTLAYVARQDDQTFDAMTRYVKDPDQNVRVDLMYEIYRLGERSVPTLMQGLRDSTAPVRKAAIFGLDCLGSDEALPEIAQCLNDPDTNVRVAAREALARMDPKQLQHVPADTK